MSSVLSNNYIKLLYQIIEVLKLAKYNQLEKLQREVKYFVYDTWNHDIERRNKKSILARLDKIFGNLKDRLDGMFEDRTRESYTKEG